MTYLIKCLPAILLLTTCLAQFEDYHHYEGGYKHEPVHQSLDGHGEEFDLDYHAHPKYSFDYSVKDPHTGDNKEHWETRDGDKVKGTYTVLETDGTKRVVEYEADDKNGFNAVVHKIGTPKEEIKFEHKPSYEHKPIFEHKPSYEHKPSFEHKPNFEHFSHEYHGSFGGDEGFVPVVGDFEH